MQKCSIGARQLENLVIDELKFLADAPQIIEGVVESASKEQKEKVKDLTLKNKGLRDKLIQVDKKANNFLEIIGQEERRVVG